MSIRFPIKRCAWLSALLLAALLAMLAPSLAADFAEPAAPAGLAEAPEEMDSLGEIIVDKTNWVGYAFYGVLILFSVQATAVAMERLFHLRRRRIVPRTFVTQLRQIVSRDDYRAEDLRWLSKANPSPAANILEAGLLRAGRPLVEVEKAMEDAAASEMAEIRSRNRALSVLGNVAPLVGLLGTVVGMIFAFRISSLAGMGKAELLAEGIYLALLTTAMGLMIAVPCLLLAAWFNNRAERYFREIDKALQETLPGFIRFEKGIPEKRVSPDGQTRPEPMVAAK